MKRRGRRLLGTKLLSGIFMAVLCCGLAEGTGTARQRAPVTLRLWYPWTNEERIYGKVFEETLEEFNREAGPVAIVAEGMDTEIYREKLPTAIAQDETPDLFFCYADAYLENIVRSGKLLELTEYLSDEYEQKHKAAYRESVAWEGGVYGIDFAVSRGVFLVNQELFERYGYETPKTWESFAEVCRGFLENGLTPLACSSDTDTGFRMYLEALVLTETGAAQCRNIFDGEEAVTQSFRRGTEKFRELADMGAFGDPAVHRSTYQIEEAFTLSKIPMYYAKDRFLGEVLQKNNPLYGKIQVIPFPNGPHRAEPGGVCEAFVVNASTEHPQEAVRALEELMERFSRKLYERGACLPTWETEGEIDAVVEEPYLELVRLQEEYGCMPYWEFCMDAQKAAAFLEQSTLLYEGGLSVDHFLELF